jgi:hypothetical protein
LGLIWVLLLGLSNSGNKELKKVNKIYRQHIGNIQTPRNDTEQQRCRLNKAESLQKHPKTNSPTGYEVKKGLSEILKGLFRSTFAPSLTKMGQTLNRELL